MTHIRDQILAEVNREIEQMTANRAAITDALEQRGRRTGGSIVYSLRLDAGEVTALEQRAREMGIKPSVLARNLIRMGLASPTSVALEGIVDRLDRAMGDLRALAASRLRTVGDD